MGITKAARNSAASFILVATKTPAASALPSTIAKIRFLGPILLVSFHSSFEPVILQADEALA